MPATRTPYPPLDLDFDEISSVRQAPQSEAASTGPTEETPSDERLTAAPAFDLEAFARDAMTEARVAQPESAVHPIAPHPSELPTTLPPAPTSSEARAPSADAEPRGKGSTALVAEMNEYLAAEDFSAALVVADAILAADPTHKVARQGSLRCQAALELVYVKRLGPLSQIPSVAVAPKEIPNLALDHRSGFILALVDGLSTLDMILDMSSGMRRLETLRVLLELVQQGILRLA